MSEVDNLLTKGLAEGYTGGTEIKDSQRGDITVKSSEYRTPEGDYYIDQWIDGGGQEIARLHTGEGKTRAYAGITIPDEKLEELGLKEEEITSYLISKVKQLNEQTRLGTDCTPEPDGDWQYRYIVVRKLEDIGLVMGLEEILYKDTRVFAHGFSLSPTKIKMNLKG